MCTDNEWTPGESRKQTLDSAWSMEMSKLTRDGTAEPVSRDQILRRKRGQRIIHFPCSAAEHELDWQPCPAGREGHTYKHSSTYTYRCSYTHIYTPVYAYYTTMNRARMYTSPNKKYTSTWYINQYKQQYCTSIYVCTYHGYS